MQTKLFEIRDHSTCIPALGTRPNQYDNDRAEEWLWTRAGFGNKERSDTRTLVCLTYFANHRMEYDPLSWADRTMTTAHNYIATHWDELQSGAVIDVRFILGETDASARSDSQYDIG